MHLFVASGSPTHLYSIFLPLLSYSRLSFLRAERDEQCQPAVGGYDCGVPGAEQGEGVAPRAHRGCDCIVRGALRHAVP